MIIEDGKLDLENFLSIKEGNIEAIEFHFNERISNLNELYNILLRYSIPFFGDDDLLYHPENKNYIERIVFQNNNSIISLLDGVLTLISEGNFLSVKILLRSIFEFLIINNHLILTKDDTYIKKWIEDKDIKIVKNILKRTNNQQSKELIEFWVNLSQHNHASPNTSRSNFDYIDNYGKYVSNNFMTYIILVFYNYQLRELYFPFMQNIYKTAGVEIEMPFKSDWFKRKDKIKKFETVKNPKLKDLYNAFTFKWELKKKIRD